MFAIIK